MHRSCLLFLGFFGNGEGREDINTRKCIANGGISDVSGRMAVCGRDSVVPVSKYVAIALCVLSTKERQTNKAGASIPSEPPAQWNKQPCTQITQLGWQVVRISACVDSLTISAIYSSTTCLIKM